MIFLRLAGGLGNQLFQIAASYSASKRLSLPVYICEDSLKRYKEPRAPLYRSLLNLPSSIFFDNLNVNQHLIDSCLNLRLGKLPFFGLRRIPPRKLVAIRRHFPLFMDGYYQDCWVVDELLEVVFSIRSMLEPSPASPSLPELLVAIHVRGGDFLGLPDFNFVDYSYYKTCVGQAFSRGLLNFGIVSDDPVFSGKIMDSLATDYPGASFALCSGASPLDDFHIMRTAHSRIIGNSTFAWWAFALSLSSGLTWTPGAFLRNRPLPYRLPNEVVVTAC